MAWGTGVNFPVLNMHSHAWPLYSVVKLLGAEFHPHGVRFKPVIPLPEYDFNTTLLEFKKTRKDYSGWYAPTTPGHWIIEVKLAEPELGRLKHLIVNGESVALNKEGQSIRLRGDSASGAPLQWEIGIDA